MLVSTEGPCEHSKVQSSIYPKVRDDCRQVVQLPWKKEIFLPPSLSSPHSLQLVQEKW